MTDASWNFKDVEKDPVGSADDIVICPRHPIPKDLPPLSSPTKGSDFLSFVFWVPIATRGALSNSFNFPEWLIDLPFIKNQFLKFISLKVLKVSKVSKVSKISQISQIFQSFKNFKNFKNF